MSDSGDPGMTSNWRPATLNGPGHETIMVLPFDFLFREFVFSQEAEAHQKFKKVDIVLRPVHGDAPLCLICRASFIQHIRRLALYLSPPHNAMN